MKALRIAYLVGALVAGSLATAMPASAEGVADTYARVNCGSWPVHSNSGWTTTPGAGMDNGTVHFTFGFTGLTHSHLYELAYRMSPNGTLRYYDFSTDAEGNFGEADQEHAYSPMVDDFPIGPANGGVGTGGVVEYTLGSYSGMVNNQPSYALVLNGSTSVVGTCTPPTQSIDVSGVTITDQTSTTAVAPGDILALDTTPVVPSNAEVSATWSAGGSVFGTTDPAHPTIQVPTVPLGTQITAAVHGAVSDSSAPYWTASNATTPSIATTTTTPAPPGTLTSAVPAITGSPRVGAALTAIAGTWSPRPVTLGYQWFRGPAPVSGATAPIYKLTSADLGKQISVEVTGTKTGYLPDVERSAPTAPVGAGALAASTPTITGLAKVGAVLTAHAGTWGPAPVALHYQWFRGAVPIKGATGAKYHLTIKDKGRRLKVRIVGTKVGYASAIRYSKPTSLIKG